MSEQVADSNNAQDGPAFPVAGIGASAGGVRALQEFFGSLPDEVGAAFVVILHLDPEHDSELDRIIAARTRMPVVQVGPKVALQPNHIYVIPPNRRLFITDRDISAAEFDEPRGRRAPIDLFFRSLANQHSDGFAIILTGAGSDGAVGVKAVKEGGGLILVQDPNEAEFPSMPRAAVSSGYADFVLPLRELAQQFVELVQAKQHISIQTLADTEDDTLRRIFGHLRSRTGHDFSKYKRATVLRRIGRRMQVAKRETLADYLALVRDNSEELQALFADLLISVTNFFRDPKAFEALARDVIPRIFEAKGPDDAIRVWVPGCATGEEAYSIAMLLLEEASRRKDRPEIHVFASDLDASALAAAREGCYPVAIRADVSEERLHRFFTLEGDHYRIKREIRDVVLFAMHSLLKDPPFSRLDLVSCRNLMIYLDRDLQQQVCGTCHYALLPDGYLFLGSSETAETPSGLFRTRNREMRIFQSIDRPHDKPPVPILQKLLPPRGSDLSPLPPARRAAAVAGGATVVHRQALEEMAPPSILVDETRHVLHVSESAGRYMHLSAGPPTLEASELVRPELRTELRAALYRAFDKREPSLSFPMPVRFNGSEHMVALLVRPVERADAARAALIMFLDGGTVPHPIEAARTDARELESVVRLTDELLATRSHLSTSRQEFETANEDLRAANEELQSINEEYRSTAEELETSKEELQSMNEELQTLNSELKLKLEAVSRAHNDLQNLMGATEVGTLFLDAGFLIKRFTPVVTDLFNIKAGDEGRPISDFTHRLDYADFARDAKLVLESLTSVETEIRSTDDRWFLLRIRPYRTLEDKIEGVVATFVDISGRKRAEEELRESETRLRQAREAAALGTLDLNWDQKELWWDARARALWQLEESEQGALADFWAGIHRQDISAVQAAVEAALDPSGGGRLAVEFRIDRPAGGPETWIRADGMATFASQNGRKRARRLVMAVQDMTVPKAWEMRQALLMRELTHRVKNILSVVQAIARYSLQRSGAKASALDDFGKRLRALGAASDLLVERDWGGADLAAVTRLQLEPYLEDASGRVRLAGPWVLLPPDIASQLSLVLHELATNASKYGALSKPAGGLVVTWQITERADGRDVNLVWREHGGPPIKKPSKTGFGSHIIERGLPNAKVQRDFQSSGLVCTIDFPVPRDSGVRTLIDVFEAPVSRLARSPEP